MTRERRNPDALFLLPALDAPDPFPGVSVLLRPRVAPAKAHALPWATPAKVRGPRWAIPARARALRWVTPLAVHPSSPRDRVGMADRRPVLVRERVPVCHHHRGVRCDLALPSHREPCPRDHNLRDQYPRHRLLQDLGHPAQIPDAQLTWRATGPALSGRPRLPTEITSPRTTSSVTTTTISSRTTLLLQNARRLPSPRHAPPLRPRPLTDSRLWR